MTGPNDTTMLAVFLARARAMPDRVAIEELAAGGAPADVSLTWAQWRDASRSFAAALVADGVQRGDRVAILADNRVLWPVADIGILMAGAVSVGVYPTSAPSQIRDQLADCDAVAIVVDTVEHLASVLAVADELPTLRRIVWRRGRRAHGPDAIVARLSRRRRARARRVRSHLAGGRRADGRGVARRSRPAHLHIGIDG